MGDTAQAIGRLKLFNDHSGNHKLLSGGSYTIIKEWELWDYLEEMYPNGDHPQEINGDEVVGADGTLFFCFSHYGYGFSMHDNMERYLSEKGILSQMKVEPNAVLTSKNHNDQLLVNAGALEGGSLGEIVQGDDSKSIAGDNQPIKLSLIQRVVNKLGFIRKADCDRLVDEYREISIQAIEKSNALLQDKNELLQDNISTNQELFESDRQRLSLQLKLNYYRMICDARVGLENTENEACLFAIEEMKFVRNASAHENALAQLQSSVKAFGYLNGKTNCAERIKLDDNVNDMTLSPFVLNLLSVAYKEGYQIAVL